MADSTGKLEHRLICLIALALALGTFICYAPARDFDFVTLDDPAYVSQNPMVEHGLSWAGVTWAFHSVQGGNWNPLVWLSHMAVCQFFGPAPEGHHLTNITLHAINAMLLFLVLWQMTATIWRSAFVAAIFAWHPMHVESVAWISERKDVLSALFWLLTMWAYACYATKAQAPRARRSILYGLALACFVLGLMSKPMLVALPAILLLLDYWPLRRVESFWKLLLEKIPFAAASVAACVLAIWTQKQARAVGPQSLLLRLENVPVSYVTYAIKFFWPTKLSIFYPFPDSIPTWSAVGAALALLLITIAVALFARRRPYLVTGWLWFLVTLLPVIGLLQVGMQARADRYTYIPYIGLSVMLSWGMAELARRWQAIRPLWTLGAAAALGCWMAVTSHQVWYWKDSVALYEHALDVAPENYLAHNSLGGALKEIGKLDAAIQEHEKVIQLRPGAVRPYTDLTLDYILEHKMDDAFAAFCTATRLNPVSAQAILRGELVEGVSQGETNLSQKLDDVELRSRFVDVLFKLGKGADAVPYCRKVVEARPTDPHAWFGLGAAWLAQSRMQDAIESFKQAIELAPDNPQCLNALAWIYATSSDPQLRNGPEAIRLAEKACAITRRQNPAQLETLAAAYAQAGRFDDAVKTAEEMLAIAQTSGDFSSREIGRKHLELYKAGIPCCGAP